MKKTNSKREQEKTPVKETAPADEGLTANQEQLDALASTVQETAPVEGEVPKRRGRKPGSKNKSKVVITGDVLPKPLVRSLVSLPYSIIAKYRGSVWELTEEEAEQLVETHQTLLNEYLPGWIGDNAALYAVLFQHTLLIAARIMIEQKEKTLVRDTGLSREEREREVHKGSQGLAPLPSSPLV